MAGLYIHIPFCRKACHYCNFHFSTNPGEKKQMVQAICTEIRLRYDFFGDTQELSSIYLGGGTPSILEIEELTIIFDAVFKYFSLGKNAEITLEANPDDLSREYVQDLKAYTPVNRLSIGVQSLNDDALKWMNRTHTASQCLKSVEDSLKAGFNNISADLIYGLPEQYSASWKSTLDMLLSYRLPHISAYALTIEPKTALAHQVKKGLAGPSEEANDQFLELSQIVRSAGYRHYEISNIALPGFEAGHNSSYWKGEPYLGIGPSAHSFKGDKRSWNIANNAKYIHAILHGEIPMESEILSTADKYNEYIMTGLRLEEGVNVETIERHFGKTFADHFADQLSICDPALYSTGEAIRLTDEGRLWCDKISSSLFYTV